MKIKQPKGFTKIKQPKGFKSTRWMLGIGSANQVAIWALTHPNPLEYMDVIEACANGETLNETDAIVIVTIMESPEFLRPRLNNEQLKIYDRAYERYCAEATFIMMKK